MKFLLKPQVTVRYIGWYIIAYFGLLKKIKLYFYFRIILFLYKLSLLNIHSNYVTCERNIEIPRIYETFMLLIAAFSISILTLYKLCILHFVNTTKCN